MTNDASNPQAQQPPASNPALERLDVLAGEWTFEGTNAQLENPTIRGRVTFEWLDGGSFLIQRSEAAHPDVPNTIAIIGPNDASQHCTMHYFDSRGVSRVYEMDVSEGVWSIWRDAPGFSQRFTGVLSDDGATIAARWDLSTDDVNWEHDFDLTYTKVT